MMGNREMGSTDQNKHAVIIRKVKSEQAREEKVHTTKWSSAYLQWAL